MSLVQDYAAISFMTHHRMEASKKKLSFLSLKDFITCAMFMLDNWTCRTLSECGSYAQRRDGHYRLLARIHKVSVGEVHVLSVVLTDCAHEESCLDLDREFLVYLRDCKVVTERDFIDRVKDHTIALVRSSLSKHALIDLEQNLKNYLRILVNMAYNLNHTKEFRDFFLDCVEKVSSKYAQFKFGKTEYGWPLQLSM